MSLTEELQSPDKMNSTQESSDGPDNQSAQTIGTYGYSFGISFGFLLFLVVITYSYYMYTRIRAASPNHNSRDRSGGSSIDTTNTQGLDEATLRSYPKLLYSQAKTRERDCSASGCSICLQDYKDIDMLRLLPECGHFFHLKCADSWLRLHPTCPICRNSPMPTPSDTPLS